MFFIRQHWVVLAIFTLSLIVRLLYLGFSLHANGNELLQTISGADGYFNVSQNLIQGHGLSSSVAPPYVPYSFRPPVYHYFIAGSYFLLGGYFGVIILQIILGSVLPVLGYYLATFLLSNRKICAAVGFFLAVEPSSILYSTIFYSEILFIFLFLLSLLCLFKYFYNTQRAYFYLSAQLLGIATLTRPTTEFLPILILGIVIWLHRRALTKKIWIDVAGYALLFLLVLAPWSYRNYVTFGTPEISPLTGVSLYSVLLPTVYSIERGTTFQVEYKILEDAGVLGPNIAPVTVGSEYVRTAIPLLIAHPKALALSFANSELNFFVQDGTFDFLRHIKVRPREMLGRPATFVLLSKPLVAVKFVIRNFFGPVFFIVVGRVTWIIVTLAAFIGVWQYVRRYNVTPYLVTSVSVTAYFALTSAITGLGLTSRYRLPVNPLILIFACFCLARLLQYGNQYLRRLYA